METQNLFSFLPSLPTLHIHPTHPSPLLSPPLLEPIKCQLLFSSSKMLARCQPTLLKLCHCKLKACKSLCQWHAIRLGIYNKNCDAAIKGTASLPSICNANKRSIKMFHSIHKAKTTRWPYIEEQRRMWIAPEG